MKNKTDRMNRKHLCKKNVLPLRGMALVLCLVLLLPSLFACTTPEEGTTPAATTPAETTTVTTTVTTTTAAADEPSFVWPEETPLSATINTAANDIFFPTERSALHREELMASYEAFLLDHEFFAGDWGSYEIYNYISEEKSEQYDLDILEVYYSEVSMFLIRHGEKFYEASIGQSTRNNTDSYTNFAVTDINGDGYIEILVGKNGFADRGNAGFYCRTYIRVIDTYLEETIRVSTNDAVSYLKENEAGVVSIYGTRDVQPAVEDVTNGKMDERYFALATELRDTPVLNTSCYEFRESSIEAACEMYKVEITVLDTPSNFPYRFRTALSIPEFELNVKMTFLGETYSYKNGDSYLDGARVVFKNATDTISVGGSGFGAAVITRFIIQTGMVIEHTHYCVEPLQYPYAPGVYDMEISYRHMGTGEIETITIKDFLRLTR